MSRILSLSLERTVPYHLRCRASTIATPSAWPDPETATSCSPDVTRGDLHLTFQASTISEMRGAFNLQLQ